MKTITYDETLWVLVPRQPTETMKDAGRNAPIPLLLLDSISENERLRASAIYKAMLTAAPQLEHVK